MEARSREVRAAFVEGSRFVLDAIEAVGDDQWQQPGLGEWTVRELAVHATRAWSTVVTYAATAGELTLSSPGEYYLSVLGTESLHEQVAQRTRAQAADIDTTVLEYARSAFAEAETVLERTPADHVIECAGGGIRVIDYLPTRVVELVVHGIDLCDAIGRAVEVPPLAMETTLQVLAELAVRRPAVLGSTSLVRALTGRGTLAADTNLLG